MKRNYLTKLRDPLRHFRKSEDGDINTEAILFLPLLIMMIVVSLVFFDVFRKYSLTQKAAYAVGDMISRETSVVGPDYMTSVRKAAAVVANVDLEDVTLRVTQVSWHKKKKEYRVNWSHVSGDNSYKKISKTQANDVNTVKLPPLAGGERVLLVDVIVKHWYVENWRRGNFWIGADEGHREVKQRTFTRPRFAPKVVWNASM